MLTSCTTCTPVHTQQRFERARLYILLVAWNERASTHQQIHSTHQLMQIGMYTNVRVAYYCACATGSAHWR
jgi:hypothetical protein